MSDETQNGKNPEENEDEKDQESTESEGVDQVSLADEWEKMAEAGEINVDEAEAEAGEAADASDDVLASDVDQQAMIDEWEQMAAESSEASEASIPDVSESMMATTAVEGGIDFSTLMDIPLEISVEVGNAMMTIEELLHLSPNSVIELDKFISEPVDIRVNGRLIARGELYTVEGNFAIKITAIMTPQDRMKIVEDQPW